MNAKTNTFIPSGNWTTSRLEKKLLEFFRKEGLNAILGIYSVNQRFQIDGVRYWMQEGYLECAGSFDEENILGAGIGQSYEVTYRLTEKGKRHISKR